MSPERLRGHDIRLQDGDLLLRPMTEEDWDLLYSWSSDPEVHWWSEGGDVPPWSLEEIQGIYRRVSACPADVFILELDGQAIGDGWVQAMNRERILSVFPGLDCRRIDLQLARPWWGRGLGSRAIRLMTTHAFAQGADLVWAIDVRSDNDRSRAAFRANGYVNWRRVAQPAGSKSAFNWDLVCRRQHFEGRAAVAEHPGPDRIRAGDEPFGAMVVVYRRSPDLDLLVLHRRNDDVGDWGDWAWTPPAGARFPAEPPDDCAARELHEEAGIEAKPQRMVGVGGPQWWMYALEAPSGVEVILDEEHDRYEWVPAAEAVRRCQPDLVSVDIAAAVAALTQ